MILTKEQTQGILFGALEYAETDDGYLHPLRFTSKQIETLGRLRKDWGEKAYATSGVCFDFYTDSTTFAFDAKITPATTRFFYYFDLMTDGVLTHHEGEEKYEKVAEKHIEFKLTEGRHRVTVWFPNLNCAMIKNVTLDDGAEVTPFEHKAEMLSLGDSITQGYDAVYSSLSYPNIVAMERGYELVNQGIGGLNLQPESIAEYGDYRPDIVTVAFGTNDWNVKTREAFERDCVGVYDAIKHVFPTQTVYAILPIWRGDTNRLSKCGDFTDACSFLRNVAKERNCIIIEGINATPHHPDFYSDKIVHPNDICFKFYGDYLLKTVK